MEDKERYTENGLGSFEDAGVDNGCENQISASSEYEPKNKYEKCLFGVYKNDTLSEILRISSHAIVLLTVYAFFVRLTALIDTPIEILKLLLITGVPFFAVSVTRRVINAPRPYELLPFYEKPPKSKTGSSFPSRHVFSIFCIATVLIPWNAAIAALLFVGGVLLSVIRVLLGMHFIRDVVIGAAIGLISGGIGLLILNFI